MKYFIPFLFIPLLLSQSCKKANLNEGVPSYINIPFIDVIVESNQGSDSHKITDAWIYFDNDLQGIYPLPTTFPVIKEGAQNISIKGGIKNNGAAATRVNYPFYDYYNTIVFLTKNSTTIINPEVRYFDNAEFYIIDFENGSENNFDETYIGVDSDTCFLIHNDTVFEGNSAGVHLAEPHQTFEIATEEIQLPKVGTPVYVELNYKCNTPFQVGLFSNFSQTVSTTSIATIKPKSKWSKIYIDLTSILINTQQANSHKVFISMNRNVNSSEMSELYLDNFKIVY